MSKKSTQYRVSTIPRLIEETGRIYIGCEKFGQRFEVSVCDSRRCKQRKKCRQYQEAVRMREDLENEKPKRRRKKKTEEFVSKPARRRRKSTESVTNSTQHRRRTKKVHSTNNENRKRRRRK